MNRLHFLSKALSAALFASLLLASPVSADPATDTLVIDGLVKQPLHLTASDLAALPSTDAPLPDTSFAGPSLWSLLDKAGFGDDLANRKTRAKHYILATGSDGYEVVIALGELDPDLEGKSVIIALKRDGKPLDPKDGFRLVVPGDHHGARGVHQLVHLEVK